jgi:hypothetical protein
LTLAVYKCETYFINIGEEHRVKMFANRVIRKTFGPKERGNRRTEMIT